MGDYSDKFVVVDVETANHNLSSICQIGIACFADGALRGSWESLVNPEDYFDSINISIHGIHDQHVKSAPTWPAVYPEVKKQLEGNIVVSHMPFDRAALHRACEKYRLTPIEYQWLDSAGVVRCAWPMFARSGYGLSNVAQHFSISYKQHDALEDARCAGEILLRAIAETGWTARQWLDGGNGPIAEPISHDAGSGRHKPAERRAEGRIICDGNAEGPLRGEVLVFTGVLSMPRGEAENIASAAGCEVDASVTKRTTLLVVGDEDIRTKLAGHQKSLKNCRAEELITKGQHIRIIGENDFRHLCGLADGRTKGNRTALEGDANRKEKCEEGPKFCGKCGKPIDRADNFCGNCGRSAGYGASPVRVDPAVSAAPVRTKTTDQMKLGAVIFAVSMFGACPAVFISEATWVWALVLVGMILGAVTYFAGS